MLKQFARKIEELRRLIDDSRSASLSHCATSSSVMSSEQSESRHLFLLAVSGGMDSMCLLDLFSKVLQPSEYAVAHCNFSLRGDESDGDHTLVEARAAELGVRVFVKRFDTVAYAQERGISIEMAARELRYAWFEQLCMEQGFDVLAVAHNANDNAETLMLNLLRGTGLNGLHGMAEISVLDSRTDNDLHWAPPPGRGWSSLCPLYSSLCHPERLSCHPERSEGSVLLFRPLLEYTRKQIEGYVLIHRVPYRHDSSNFESDYKRNRIRNDVFPVFEKINPSFVRTLNREIGYFAEAGSIVEDWCRSQMSKVLVTDVVSVPSLSPVMSSERSESKHLKIDTAALLATPHWRYLLYYILEPYGFNSPTLASIESLLASDRTVSGKRFESPTHILHTAQDSLIVVGRNDRCAASERSIPLCSCSTSRGTTGPYDEVDENPRLITDAKDDCLLSDDVMVVRGAGIYNFNGSRFHVEILEWTDTMPLKQPQGTLVFDADKLKFPFVCRRWRQGDWLVPLGMRGKKKVSDLFTGLKFNTLQKEASILIVDTLTPGFADQQHIVALLGVRIDDRYKVTPSTRTVLCITIL